MEKRKEMRRVGEGREREGEGKEEGEGWSVDWSPGLGRQLRG